MSVPVSTCADQRSLLSTLALAAIILVGACLRFAYLTYYPSGFGGHALGHSLHSIYVLENLYPALLELDWQQVKKVFDFILSEQHGPQAFVESLGFLVMGVGLEQAYANAALLGSISLLVCYAAVAAMFDRRTGIIAALLLSVSWWHLKLSRHGEIEHALSPFLLFLSLWGASRAASSPTFKRALLGGVLCGLNVYVYAPNQVLLMVLPGLVLLLPLLRGEKFLRTSCYFLVYAGSMLAVAVPQLWWNYERGKEIPLRSSYGTNTYDFVGTSQILRQLGEFFHGIAVQVNDPWFNRAGGALTWLEISFALIGTLLLICALFKPAKRGAALMVLSVLLVGPLPAVMGMGAPFRRGIIFACACLIVTSIAVERLVTWWMTRKIHFFPRALVLTAAAATFMIQQAKGYFVQPDTTDSSGAMLMTELVRYVRNRLGVGGVVILYPKTVPDYRDFYRKYLDIIAYDNLQDLRKAGVPLESRCIILDEHELGAALPTLNDSHVEIVVTTEDERAIREYGDKKFELSRLLSNYKRDDLPDKFGFVIGARFTKIISGKSE